MAAITKETAPTTYLGVIMDDFISQLLEIQEAPFILDTLKENLQGKEAVYNTKRDVLIFKQQLFTNLAHKANLNDIRYTGIFIHKFEILLKNLVEKNSLNPYECHLTKRLEKWRFSSGVI
ncbi:hypothetical protein [Flaviramulus aquimarinus]